MGVGRKVRDKICEWTGSCDGGGVGVARYETLKADREVVQTL